ncbi:MAG TPA: phosphotransferase family protein [Pyrinomonadaceae bacterium]|jgi:aminoglycoside phosphotransferase (APT) family kinase protein|nr:phosphotransferase family protein [Pyrinomonadaceae bacterium]
MTIDPSFSDTRQVRTSEQLDWDALAVYVRERLVALPGERFDASAPMTVEQFPGGHSNLTYLLRFGHQEFVMRRPPFGPVPPRAHDMAREYRILEAVHPVYSLAPRPFMLCEEMSVIGSTFYVMERRRGLVVRTEEPPELAGQPEERRRASLALVDALARLHLVDIHAHGLTSLGKPTGFVERQVRGWSERWHGSRTSELREMDALAAWLMERLPPDPQRPTLVHGDFKLDNVMLDARDVGRLVGVFDWEMAAVGDPLIDLGILLAYWVHVANAARGADAVSSVTNREGWFTRAEILERYDERTALELANITFYEVFAVFKLAVVLQQIFYRYHRGQTDDPRFATLDERVAWLARVAAALAEKA